jgi:transposase
MDGVDAMSRLFWLNDDQWSKIEPLLPHYGSPPRVDDRRILSGIIHVLRLPLVRLPGRLRPPHHGLQPLQPLKGIWQRIYACRTGDQRTPRQLLADKAYDSDKVRDDLARRGTRAVIPNKDDRKYCTRSTKGATGSATPSNACSVVSRISGALPPDTTSSRGTISPASAS